jgi:hypothetical protein
MWFWGDVDLGDVVAVPYRLEDRVGQPENQQVLHGLLGQVVIDAEDLLLGEVLLQGRVQLQRRLQVAAEGFLHHDARPAAPFLAGDARPADVGGDGHVLRRRDRQVEQPVAAGPVFLVQLFQVLRQALVVGRGVVHNRLVVDPAGEILPARHVASGVLHGFF